MSLGIPHGFLPPFAFVFVPCPPGEFRAHDRRRPLSRRKSKRALRREVLAVGIGHLGGSGGQERLAERQRASPETVDEAEGKRRVAGQYTSLRRLGDVQVVCGRAGNGPRGLAGRTYVDVCATARRVTCMFGRAEFLLSRRVGHVPARVISFEFAVVPTVLC